MPGLDPAFEQQLNALLEAGRAAGHADLEIISGYRTPERQAQLWEEALTRYGSPEAARQWVAPPGRSYHNQGMAADIGYGGAGLGQAPPEVVDWLHANAADYGLTFPLSNENWHIEPVGARNGGGVPGLQAASQGAVPPQMGQVPGLPVSAPVQPSGPPVSPPSLTALSLAPASAAAAPEPVQTEMVTPTIETRIQNMDRGSLGQFVRSNYGQLSPDDRAALARSMMTT